MLKLFPLTDPRRFLCGGRVHCPMRSADVEADVCAACPRLEEMQADGKLPFVRCRPRASLLLPEA